MNLANYDSIYFLGIDGIGMKELARWFKGMNKTIAGCSMAPGVVVDGIDIHSEENVDLIPTFVNKKTTLVIYTPALSKSHAEWTHLEDNGFTIMRRSEVLHLIVKDLDIIEDIEKLIV